MLFCFNLLLLAYCGDFYKLGWIHFQQTIKQYELITLQVKQARRDTAYLCSIEL